jgi:hypothetical protein
VEEVVVAVVDVGLEEEEGERVRTILSLCACQTRASSKGCGT